MGSRHFSYLVILLSILTFSTVYAGKQPSLPNPEFGMNCDPDGNNPNLPPCPENNGGGNSGGGSCYDDDDDGVCNGVDNCRTVPNSYQSDLDQDGRGDACEIDQDNDGVLERHDGYWDPPYEWLPKEIRDNCSSVANSDQKDQDKDGYGDACDSCPQLPPDENNPNYSNDSDGDRIYDLCDNCPHTPNKDQKDSNQDGKGDACQLGIDTPKDDVDMDGIADDSDNCPQVCNHDQKDTNQNNIGDVCEAKNPLWLFPGTSGKSTGNRLDTNQAPDQDNDGIPDSEDNCPNTCNHSQTDSDQDGRGNACELNSPGDIKASGNPPSPPKPVFR